MGGWVGGWVGGRRRRTYRTQGKLGRAEDNDGQADKEGQEVEEETEEEEEEEGTQPCTVLYGKGWGGWGWVGERRLGEIEQEA